MLDMDEYLYIVNNSLANYLNRPIFDKCDFINIHWVIPTDNDLLYYDKRPLFERFKGPYLKTDRIKTIVKGNISNLIYGVHGPIFSPQRNITCNNEGKIINKPSLVYFTLNPTSYKDAYIIHFRYKSTQEFIIKYKRGYRNWFGNKIKEFLNGRVKEFFQFNRITLEKIQLIEKELNLNLSEYKTLLFSNKTENKQLIDL